MTEVALGIAGIAAFATVFRWPWIGLCVSVALPQVGLLFFLLRIDGTTQTTVAFALIIAALIGGEVRRRRVDATRLRFVTALLSFALLYGLVIGAAELHSVQVFQGARILLLPLLAALVARRLKATELQRALAFLTIIMLVSAAVAAWQLATGSNQLAALGFDLGTTVRTYEGNLRASGLAMTNYDLGSFAAAFAAITLVWWLPQQSRWSARLFPLLALIAAVVALFASIYRTGFVLLILSLSLWFFTRKGLTLFTRFVGLMIASGLIYAFAYAGFGSSASLVEREDVWARVISMFVTARGLGIGAAGAASNSSFSTQRIVTDNYFLNILVQFGYIVGGLLIFIAVGIAIYAVVRARRGGPESGGFVLAAMIVSFWFVEFWEYSAAAMIVCAVWAFGNQNGRSRQDRNFVSLKPIGNRRTLTARSGAVDALNVR